MADDEPAGHAKPAPHWPPPVDADEPDGQNEPAAHRPDTAVSCVVEQYEPAGQTMPADMPVALQNDPGWHGWLEPLCEGQNDPAGHTTRSEPERQK